MKKFVLLWLLVVSAAVIPQWVLGNEIFNRAAGFEIPNGSIAYMGSFFSPLKVRANGSDDKYLVPRQNVLFADKFFTAEKTQAVNETNQSLQEKAVEMKLPLDAVPFDEAYQNALLMHVLTPAKYLYNPGITAFCWNRPYILIVIIDYYAEFSSSINIREKQNDQKINYWGRRSIIEKDLDMFRNKGRQSAVALEFFLISTKDGSTLWQANTITTANGLGANYYDIAKGLSGTAFKNLLKQ